MITGLPFNDQLKLLKIAVVLFILTVTPAPAVGREIVDRIVAVVNEDIISLYELSKAAEPFEKRIKAAGYAVEQEQQMLFKARKEILNKLIEERLSDQEASRFKITVTDNEVNGTIGRIKKINYYTDEELAAALKNEALSMAEYREQIREQILRKKLVDRQINAKIVITPAEVEAYYQKHLQVYGEKKKYRLSHIIMRVAPDADIADKERVFKRMKQILSALESGQPFDKLARTHSELSAEAGGDIGEFGLEELSPQLQKALAGKKESMFTDVLGTDLGYQIFFINAIKKTPAKLLEIVSDEIQEKLYREQIETKYRSWVTELRKKSHIKLIE